MAICASGESYYKKRPVYAGCTRSPIIIAEMIFMVLSSWQAIARVHPVHLMNADSAPGGCQPQTKPTNLDCKLPSAFTIAIYYDSARNKGVQPLPRLHVAAHFDCSAQVDSAFHPPWDGKMNINRCANVYCVNVYRSKRSQHSYKSATNHAGTAFVSRRLTF